MNKYKMIACDLDGTLLGSDLKLSEENRIAIKKLADKGLMIVPITGRTLCEIEEILNLPQIRYVICSNGATIYDKVTNETVFFGLDVEDTRFVFEELGKYDTFTVLHKGGRTYYEREKMVNLMNYNVSINTKELVEKYCTPVDKFDDEFIRENLESVVISFSDKDEYDAFTKNISLNPRLGATQVFDFNIEIFNKNAGKGNTLKKFSEKVGISMEDVVAIGDSYNDTQMVSIAGLGLVVENGRESLKEIADRVICSNDDHVMEYVLVNIFS